MSRTLARGSRELRDGILAIPLWMMLAKRHVRISYRASRLGMFWSTLPLGAQMLVAGLVYGRITNAPFEVILPWIAAGLISWQFFAGFVSQSLNLFVEYGGLVRNYSRPYYAYLIAAYAISAFQALHNLVLLVVVLAVIGIGDPVAMLWVFPGFAVFTLAVGWIGMPLAILSLRFSMVSNVVIAILNLAFVVTPILYLPGALGSASWLVEINPLTHVVAMLREPLLGHVPAWKSVGTALAVAAAGWTASLSLIGRFRDRISYWV